MEMHHQLISALQLVGCK